MQIKITVRNGNQMDGKQSTTFLATPHYSTKPEDLLMDPTDFYEKFAKRIPLGGHYELEIVEPPKDFFARHKLHVHIAKNGRPFVCYPPQIPNLPRAIDVFTIWCLGTVLTVEQKIDLNTVYTDLCKGNEEEFIRILDEQYGIRKLEMAVY